MGLRVRCKPCDNNWLVRANCTKQLESSWVQRLECTWTNITSTSHNIIEKKTISLQIVHMQFHFLWVSLSKIFFQEFGFFFTMSCFRLGYSRSICPVHFFWFILCLLDPHRCASACPLQAMFNFSRCHNKCKFGNGIAHSAWCVKHCVQIY